jgi:hypothetical protein
VVVLCHCGALAVCHFGASLITGATIVTVVPLWWVLWLLWGLCSRCGATAVATVVPLWCHSGHSEVNVVATVVTVAVSL